MPKTILLLGRTVEELGESEARALKRRYGENVQFITSMACTEEAHLAECNRIRPDAVLLPSEKPFFAEAVRQGHEHIIYGHGRSGWGLKVIWNLVPYPFRNFFLSYPSSIGYAHQRRPR